MRLFLFALLGALLIPPAQAYDIDTHFYGTYMMARYAGIGDDVARFMATGAGWVDVDAVTTPMGTAEQRRLNHFPADRRAVKGSVHGKWGFNFFTEASPNHPVAYIDFNEGIDAGNPLRAFGGIHKIQDSFGHAGFTAELGHAEFGHWPDRPWVEPEKYKQMIAKLFRAITAIRRRLPPEALDPSFREGGASAHVNLSSDELTSKFLANEKFTKVWTNDALRDPRYTRFAVTKLFKEFKSHQFFLPGADLQKLVKDEYFDGKTTSQEILIKIFKDGFEQEKNGGPKVFAREKLAREVTPGRPLTSGTGVGALEHLEDSEVIKRMVKTLTAGKVPEEFSSTHKTEFEFHSLIRKKEIKIRTGDWQKLIEETYGTKIRFDAKNYLPQLIKAFKILKTNPGKLFDREYWDQVAQRSARKGEVVSLPLADRVKFTLTQLKIWLWDDVIRRKYVTANPDTMTKVYEELLTVEEIDELLKKGKPFMTAEDLEKIKRVRPLFNPPTDGKSMGFCKFIFKIL